MFAKIIAIEGDQATLEIAPGVRARFDKRAILRRVDGVADSSAER